MTPMITQQISFPIRGMTCASCTERIQAGLSRVDGVVNARVNYATEQARVMYDPARTCAAMLVAAVRACGFDVPLERTAMPLRAIGTVAVPRDALVDARLDWRGRRVEIAWLAGTADAICARPSLGATFLLLARLFRLMMR